jgi:ribosomal protein S8
MIIFFTIFNSNENQIFINVCADEHYEYEHLHEEASTIKEILIDKFKGVIGEYNEVNESYSVILNSNYQTDFFNLLINFGFLKHMYRDQYGFKKEEINDDEYNSFLEVLKKYKPEEKIKNFKSLRESKIHTYESFKSLFLN